MKTSPMAGTYLGEDVGHWEKFFKFYIDFMNSESGPRG